MNVLVSPYHLTSRELPAMAALLLGNPVVTLLPSPTGEVDQDRLRTAVKAAPRYMKFMESWGWSRELWDAGVITSLHQGQDATSDVREAWSRIVSDENLATLRPFMREDLFEDEHHYLDAVAYDVLRGGPDPAICVPVNAGLDRFASMHGLVVARSAPKSVAQRAEIELATRGFALVLPVFLQASGQRVLLARDLLADVLGDLRDALSMEFVSLSSQWKHLERTRQSKPLKPSPRLTDAVAAYTQAFEDLRSELTSRCIEDDSRLIVGAVTLEAIVLPADAVLASSAAAVHHMRRSTVKRGAASEKSGLPALVDPAMQQPVLSLLVRPFGQ